MPCSCLSLQCYNKFKFKWMLPFQIKILYFCIHLHLLKYYMYKNIHYLTVISIKRATTKYFAFLKNTMKKFFSWLSIQVNFWVKSNSGIRVCPTSPLNYNIFLKYTLPVTVHIILYVHFPSQEPIILWFMSVIFVFVHNAVSFIIFYVGAIL